MLMQHDNAKVTINMCAVLTEMLYEHGAKDILSCITNLARQKKLEFVDSAAFHAILPLIPKEEARRQIELNHKINSYFFKDAYKVRGFFPPEMCFSNEVANLICSLGYEWVILSGVACPDKWPQEEIYNIPCTKSRLSIFYRDDIISNKISFRNVDAASFISELINLSNDKKDIYCITAMDAETFGHHIKHWEKLFLGRAFEIISPTEGSKRGAKSKKSAKNLQSAKIPPVKVVTISELLSKFPKKTSKPPKSSSWSSSKDDLTNKNYYPLWNSPDNPIHNLQWEHLNIAFDLLNEALIIKDNNGETARFYNISRELLDKALHSCQFWWANKGRNWDINLVNRGLILQEESILNSYKAIAASGLDRKTERGFFYELTAARELANEIRDQFFVA
jgi:predicted glycosyl hydrolase (DUF1957 family)